MTQAILLVACVVLAGTVGALVVMVRRVEARLAAVEEVAGSRPARPAHGPDRTPVELVETPMADERPDEYVITRLGEEPEEPAPALETKLFADIVMRESVVKAASFVHGVRRGLAPANRNRIWFEMRREVKRARKERKAEEREAIREWRARQRAAVRLGHQEESAA